MITGERNDAINKVFSAKYLKFHTLHLLPALFANKMCNAPLNLGGSKSGGNLAKGN